jgi:Dullard-like phosphatase family protein
MKVKLRPEDYNENNILIIIWDNLKEVNNYYKIIIDNLYSHLYMNRNNKKNYIDIKYKFPNCLELDINNLDSLEKLNIISLFFYDAYRKLNKYNFDELKYFFDSFLQRNKIKDTKKVNKSTNIKNIVVYKYNYSDGKFYYLPPIERCYKYTLVLDLDETLIYLMPNYPGDDRKDAVLRHTLMFRPCLFEFLQKMKPLYELVIFSFGTYEYVENVIKIIEKNGKIFQHVLYRQHTTCNNGEYVKDLSLLGRDLKNIIIVDDNPQVFKLQERNGICIKPFYGDVVSDRNTLKILGKILEKIRFDADEDGDIRKSLERQRSFIFEHISNNFE